VNDVPSLTSGTDGNDLLGFISNDPARRLYRLLMIIRRSDVVFTGRNLRRGTFTPASQQTDIQHTHPVLLTQMHKRMLYLIDWLGFNGTFSTNSLYGAFNKYVTVIKVKLMRKLTILRVCNTYNKPLQ